MPFEKGKSGNPEGRKKGAVGKTTQAIKEIYVQILENEPVVQARYMEEVFGLRPYFRKVELDFTYEF